MLKPGDVFTARLPDGWYTAVRVIRKVGKSFLVCTSEYLGYERPSIDEPLLRKTLVQERFRYSEIADTLGPIDPANCAIARKWLDGAPPNNFEFLGSIPPTKAEAKRECNVYGGKWHESTGNEAFLEWRWIHDRPAFEAEIRKQQKETERRRGRPQKPNSMLRKTEFWAVINLLDWKHQGKDKKILAPAIKSLTDKTTVEICRFEERLAFHLYQLDTKAHASNIGDDAYDPESDYVSADLFLYARCVVVANGREFFESVLGDPSQMPKDMEFESLLALAPSAFKAKTGEDFAYSTGCSYESFSNLAGWRE
jgi:hypothetical protein